MIFNSTDTDLIKRHRVLFTATTIMAIIHVLRTRNDHYGKRTGVQYMERI
jgi:hypothetical protein